MFLPQGCHCCHVNEPLVIPAGLCHQNARIKCSPSVFGMKHKATASLFIRYPLCHRQVVPNGRFCRLRNMFASLILLVIARVLFTTEAVQADGDVRQRLQVVTGKTTVQPYFQHVFHGDPPLDIVVSEIFSDPLSRVCFAVRWTVVLADIAIGVPVREKKKGCRGMFL